MTTINDIAKRTGVSPATVSRVLNGYPDVKVSTRKKVEMAISELGYSPGALGRRQQSGRSGAIGVFYAADGYGSLSHPFFQDVLDSFKKTVSKYGYDVLFFSVDSSEDNRESFKMRALKRNLDGLMLASISRTDRRIASLSVGDIPCMSIDLDLIGARCGYLCSDNLGGATRATEYLISMGHSSIAFVGDKFGTRPGHDRLIGYQRTLQAQHLRFRPEWVLDGDFTELGGYEATRRLLVGETKPTAIFYSGDLMAAGGMKAITEVGLSVGNDVSVVGFDDIAIASLVQPLLTTVRQSRRDMGLIAAQCLLKLIDDSQMIPPIVTVPTELIIRDSVKPNSQ